MKTSLLALLLSASLFAECPDRVELQSFKGKVIFCQTKDGSTISENCFADKNCAWKSQLDSIKKINPTEEQLELGKNPNSVKCSLAGKSVHLFRDQKNNEQTFCEILPGKFLDVSSFD